MESVFNPGDYFAPLTVGPSFRPVLMLGQLVQTTTAKWITQAPSRCLSGHISAPAKSSLLLERS